MRRPTVRLTLIALGLLLAILLVAELAARVAFGFSMDEPAMILDASCEYLPVPGEYPGGYRINSVHMRGGEFPKEKPEGEFRVLVLGDSVTAGDPATPEDLLAVSIAQRTLNEAGGTPRCRLLNASVASWSAANQFGYLKKFGDFDADAIVVVWNSADAADMFGDPIAYTTPPRLGLERAARKIITRLKSASRKSSPFREPGGLFTEANEDAFEKIVEHAETRGIPVVAIWHATRPELDEGMNMSDTAYLRAVLERHAVPLSFLDAPLREAVVATERVYLDHIHLDVEGQAVLGRVLAETIAPLRDKTTRDETPRDDLEPDDASTDD